MSEWLVDLHGKKPDLDQVCALCNLPEANVFRTGGQYYLRSAEFSHLRSAQDVFDRAVDIIDSINGCVFLFDPHFNAIESNSVTEICEDGSKRGYVFLTAVLRSRSRTSTATLTLLDSVNNETDSRDTSPVENTLRLMRQNAEIARALRFLRVDDWISLYKIFEIVKEDVKEEDQICQRRWVTKKDLIRFRRTAQSPAALGDKARHGIQSGTPPEDPMDISEARSMIRQMVKCWIDSKSAKTS
jgi:hypothetical protein